MCLGTPAYRILLLVIDMCQHIKDSEKSLIKKPEHMWLTQSFPNLFVLIIFSLKTLTNIPIYCASQVSLTSGKEPICQCRR